MDWPRRWYHPRQILENGGPFAHTEFQPSEELWNFIQDNMKILVIGAGGLGCELLKDLALMGFRNMEVIDMDTIDISNLNRQFLFRTADVGKTKAQVAADFINKRIPGANVTPHYAKIQDFDESFYKGFNIVVNGLDSIVARRWINGMLLSCLQYDDDSDDGERGMLDQSTIIPMIDGGTEGFKGNVRVVYPGMSACLDCTLDLYPPQINFPMCTIAHTPRLPEHCIEYVRVLQWPKDNPWGEDTGIDGDDPDHIQWIFEQAEKRANEYSITGVTYRLTQGVVKRIIPAVASTNAVIAAACCTEVFKAATMCAHGLNNFMNFSDAEGVYTYTYEAERREDCLACSQRKHTLTIPDDAKLREVIEKLTESASYQMKAPGITCNIGGKNKTLYMSNIKSIEERTRDNLKKSLNELGLESGQEIYVADATSPSTLTFKLKFVPRSES